MEFFYLVGGSIDQLKVWQDHLGKLNFKDVFESHKCSKIVYSDASFACCLAHRGSTVGFLLLQCSSGVVRHCRDLQVSVATRFYRVLIFASSKYLSVIYLFHVMIH